MPASTIDEVLTRLEEIIADGIREASRTGFFAALYYKVTSRVKDGIARSEFEDGARMERLDVLFANRYLEALDQWQKGLPVTGSWKTALDAANRSSCLVLQHLLLGVNAHINLDLGIATVETVRERGIGLPVIHKDFDAINAIIGSLTYEVMQEIDRVSPLLSLIGLHSANTESLLVQFSISNARDGAWCFAEDLAGRTGDDYNECIATRDKDITKLAGALIHSRGFIRLTLWVIHLFEWKSPVRIIRVLNDYKKRFMKAREIR
jgi:hypothetical protein